MAFEFLDSIVPAAVSSLPAGTGSGAVLRLASDGELYEDWQSGQVWRRVRTAPGGGSGDMLKATYDSDNNGRIDAAARVSTAPTLGTFLEKQRLGSARAVVFTGTSLTYGQDTTASGTQPGINGAGQTRTPESYPQALKGVLGFSVNALNMTVYERGFPGDQTGDMLTRWASDTVAAEVEFIEADHNDANNYGGNAGGALSVAQHIANLEALIARAITRGRSPILLTAPAPQDAPGAARVRAFQVATQAAAAAQGVPCFRVDDLLRVLPSRLVWTDGVHLTATAYQTWGAVLSMAFGPFGAAPPMVGAGDTLTALSGAHLGGTLATRAGAPDGGTTVALTTSEIMTIPFACSETLTPIITAYNPGGSAVTLGVYYYGNRAGLANLSYTVPAGGSLQVTDRAHPAGALRGLILRLDAGASLHIDRIDFQGTGDAPTVPVRTVTANYTVQPGDSVIYANAAAGPIQITLPAVSVTNGGQAQRVEVKKYDSSANAVTIVASGGLIDGAANAILDTPYDAYGFSPVPGTADWGGF